MSLSNPFSIDLHGSLHLSLEDDLEWRGTIAFCLRVLLRNVDPTAGANGKIIAVSDAKEVRFDLHVPHWKAGNHSHPSVMTS